MGVKNALNFLFCLIVYSEFLGVFIHTCVCMCECWLFNPLNAELNPICHLLALLESHHILHVSRIRVKHRVKSPLPSAGIIRSSPHSPR